ncbi:MAG TPA: carboxypeptidase-like regulatory domain-containing protein [Terriglobales bacterium]|nr:carboxypeptidase-like regulatory domain-containing protein [Terriglobales bacterium]
MRAFALALAALLLLAGNTPMARAQVGVNTGTIVGTVTDPSGAVIPGATVSISDAATGLSRTTTTNDQGRYVISTVNPGTYAISVTKQGFSATKVSNQVVSVGQQLTANVQMQVGQATQEVVVEGTSTANLQTLNATVGNTVVGNQLESLPTLGRDVSTFMTLQPGVSPDGNVAGTVMDQASFSLDGGQNTSDMDGSMTVYTGGFGGDPTGLSGSGARAGAFNTPSGVVPTPSDSVEEFKVNTANQTADFNSSSGAETKIVTKRGTNTWHGTAYEYYLDNNFNANTWDNNLTATPNPSYHYSRFGGAGGGPIINKNLLGGKTYFFANYQGFRYPNAGTFSRSIPSADMRNGILHFPDANGVMQTYNLKTLDPRGIGISPVVQQMWNQYEPAPTGANIDPGCTGISGARCDGVNEVAYKANIALPSSDNFLVARLDHDFGSKWHFMSSYRYYHLTRAVTNQVDIGGFFPGDTLGVPAATASRPSVPWFVTAGMTTNITPNTTNDFHWSLTRNFWQWGSLDAPPQLAGLGGALEPFGESGGINTVLAPYNLNAQSIRTRFWDGHDNFFRDDLTMLKGNHLFNFGGAYQRNTEWHQRSDNGGGINYTDTYQLGDSAGAGNVDMSAMAAPSGVSASTWGRDVAAVLGMVTDAQTVYVRAGQDLHLLPPFTHAEEKSHIPFYNVYFSDTWHMKPTFTLTYGLGWALEMPPVDVQGRQVELVDSSGQQLDIQAYDKQKQLAALQGQVYNPYLGFALVGNTGPGLKYPYKPFYHQFSPRIAAAWNPHFDGGFAERLFGKDSTVFRAGYGRIYGRINGVNQVLVPLLGTGLMQAVQCRNALSNATCDASQPLNVSTVFRVGPDGLTAPIPAATPTLPQPLYPGVNNTAAAAGSSLDPNFRPNEVDSIDFTIQRQIGTRTTLEVGYIGRLIRHEFYGVNVNGVPYMMTMGGQQFQHAYANVETALGCLTYAGCGAAVPSKKDDPAGYTAYISSLPVQPFFEAAIAPAYCVGYTSCTAAVVDKQLSRFENQQVWSMWSSLDNGNFNFPRTMLNTPIPGSANGANGQISGGVGDTASLGHGRYDGGFVSLRLADWKGLSAQSNLTWSKALGTDGVVQASSEITPNDPFNLDNMYGLQPFDRKLVYNAYLVYSPPFYKSQQGLLGRLLGGWNFAPVFTTGTGSPLFCNTVTDAQAFGAGDGQNFFTNENCVSNSGKIPAAGIHSGVAGTNGVGVDTAGTIANAQLNIYSDPNAIWNNFRNPILGVDNFRATFNGMRGLGYWNVDLSVRKNIRVAERFSLEAQMMFQNVFNHLIFNDPSMETDVPGSWGVLNSQRNGPRTMEFGIRASF